MKTKSIFMAFTMGALFFSGCTSSSKFPEGDWSLIGYTKDNESQRVVESSITINHQEDDCYEITGFSGVNLYAGSLSVKDSNLTVSEYLVSTKMAGEPGLMNFENSFLGTLVSADSWSLTEQGGLCLLEIKNSSENSNLVFVRFDLKETNWKLTAVAGDSSPIDFFNQPSVSFNGDGTLSVFTGLNSAQLKYKVSQASHGISVYGDGAITMVSGSPEDEMVESLLLDGLYAASSYESNGKALYLYDGEGKLLLSFEK